MERTKKILEKIEKILIITFVILAFLVMNDGNNVFMYVSEVLGNLKIANMTAEELRQTIESNIIPIIFILWALSLIALTVIGTILKHKSKTREEIKEEVKREIEKTNAQITSATNIVEKNSEKESDFIKNLRKISKR